MISLYVINVKRVQYPLNPVDSLYWVSGAPDAGGPYSPACFFFASADGARLIPSTTDLPRLIDALTQVIAQSPTASCTPGLQAIVDKLTADNTPPAPRYAQIGDTNVTGSTAWLRHFAAYGPTGHQVPERWCGVVVPDLAPNGYDTPPAILVESWSGPQMRFQFSSLAPLSEGAVRFDIAQGFYLVSGLPSCAIAVNVVNI